MPNILTTDALKNAQKMIQSGDLVGFYNYMAKQGYGYANLAKGVVACDTYSGGTTAQNYMVQAASEMGVTLSADRILNIEKSMANQYAQALIDRSTVTGSISSDWTYKQALAGHIKAFAENQLPISLWTIYTPSLFLNDAQLESAWQKSIDPMHVPYVGSYVDGMVSFDTGFVADMSLQQTKSVVTLDFDRAADIQSWFYRVGIASQRAIGSEWLGAKQFSAACDSGVVTAIKQAGTAADALLQIYSPPDISPTRPSSSVFVSYIGAHSAVLNPTADGVNYATLSDIIALERKSGNNISLRDLLANNPSITDPNNVRANVTIQIPQKVGDNLTWNFAGGVTITSNALTGEYLMVVPDQKTGETTVYSKSVDGNGVFSLKQTVTDNSSGLVISEMHGTQDGAAADPVWDTSKVRVDSNDDGQAEHETTTSVDPATGATTVDQKSLAPGGAVIGEEATSTSSAGDMSTQMEYNDEHQLTSKTRVSIQPGETPGASVRAVETFKYDPATGKLIGHQTEESSIDESGGATKVVTTDYADGGNTAILRRTTVNQNPDGSLLSEETREFADGAMRSISTITYDDSGSTEVITTADGQVQTIVCDAYGDQVSATTVKQASGTQTMMQALGTISDALTLLNAIKSGQPLPTVASGLRLASDLDPGNTVLSGAANIGSGVLSLLSLDNALKNGDVAASLNAGARLVNFGATNYASLMGYTDGEAGTALAQAFGADSALVQLGPVLPFIGMANDILHGDVEGLALDVAAYFIPGFGEVYAVFQLVSSLFGDSGPPDPWGSGHYVWNGSGIAVSADGVTGGQAAVAGFMNSILGNMNKLIADAKLQNPDSALGLIPTRMPTMSYGMDGSHFTDIDPLTGAEKHPALRYDSSGNPYNAEPGSVESFQSMGEAFMRSALAREAIAPQWEVDTAAMQSAAGDPQAGLREEERAGRAGKLAPTETGATEKWRPVVLDLNGDGIHIVDKANSGAFFDVDDSGFRKSTAWIGGDDAFLTLDRNFNGQTDSGRELFSNGKVALDARGLAGMAWADSNADGRLDASDPVFNALKVWRDANGSAAVDAGEETSLAQNGITSLNYAMGTFMQNGVTRQMASPDLVADTAGSRINVVPQGILLGSTDGKVSLIVTRVDHPATGQANADRLTGIENTELIVAAADLLANDTLGGFTGRDLALASVGNARHGTVSLDDNHYVHFQPEANYAGPDAGFDYGVTTPAGLAGTATVSVLLESLDQAPMVTEVTHDTVPVYGFAPLQQDEWGSIIGGGEALYQPYDEMMTDGDNNYFVYHHDTPIASHDTGAGQVLAADVDDPADSLTYTILHQPQFGAATINAAGHFQYTGWSAPDTPGADQVNNGPSQQDAFQVEVADPHGVTVTQTVFVTHYGTYTAPTPPGGGGGGCFPVVVDVANGGFSFTPVDQSSIFMEVNSDGWKHQISWIKPGEGLLAYDPEGRGTVTDASQISFARYVAGAQSDLEGLAAFDSNHNGALDVQDEAWSKFGIWQDSNSNGVTDPGEFKTLDQSGVVSINLSSDKKFADVDGNAIQGVAAVRMADGSTLNAADLTLAYSDKVQVTNPDGTTGAVTPSPYSPSGQEIDGTDGNDLLLGKTGNVIIRSLGGNDVIVSGDGNNRIDAGSGDDVIYAGNGADIITTGAGNSVIHSGLGNDLIIVGDGNNAIFAGGGNDVIMAGGGNNLIYARAGNNLIRAGDGDNSIVVGSGNNVVFAGNGDNTVQGGSGRVRMQVGSGRNTLIAGSGIATMIGGSGDNTFVINQAADEIVTQAGAHNTVRASIDYVMGADIQALELSGTANLTGTGNDFDNTLTGNAGNSTLIAGNGNDTLIAGSGVTTMIGGIGNDTFVVKHSADVVQAQAGGNQAIQTYASYTASSNVANLTAVGRLSVTLTGNSMANVLTANDSDDVLIAGTGAATMVGGSGNDTFVVNKAADVVVEQQGHGIDTVMSSIGYTLGDNLENLILTGTAIQGTGNALDNVITGNDADNLLAGGGGRDTLVGGKGDDTYLVDTAGESVVETLSGGIDTVLASISYVLPDQVENLTLTGTADLNGTGNALDNVLRGNSGNNILDGGLGNDSYFYNFGDGLDTLVDAGGNDTLRFGAGLTLDNVALRLTSADGVTTAHVRILDAEGCELPDHGFDFVMSADDSGNPVSPIDAFQFADGASMSWTDLQIKTVVTNGVHSVTSITTGRNDDIIYAGNNQHNTIDSGAGNDTVYAFNQGDTVSGGGGNDILVGGAGDDTLDGGCGSDILAGGHGDDVLRDLDDDGSNALLGGFGNDTILAGPNADFIAGGRGDDTISAGAGANVIAYNKNEGSDTITPSAGARNALSLGGGISEGDLAMHKTGNDLVLETGNHDQITFKDWYAAAANHNVVTLQMIEDASNDYQPGSADPLVNTRIVDFDFQKLVAGFDQARALAPGLASWSLMNGMLDAYLGGSDTDAIGGDLVYQYGAKNGIGDIGLDSGQAELLRQGFGSTAHAFHRGGSAFAGEQRVA